MLKVHGENVKKRGMKMKFVKHGLAVVIVCTLMLGGAAQALVYEYFPDVPYDAEYAEAVNTLAELGIIAGDQHGNFNPDSTITRAEFATMMCRMLGVEDEALAITESGFSDVPSGHWASGYIAKTVELGIFGGYGGGRFGPSDALLYEQAVAILVRLITQEEQVELAGGWPKGYIAIAQESGLTKGTTISVGSQVSRGTIATLLFNMYH